MEKDNAALEAQLSAFDNSQLKEEDKDLPDNVSESDSSDDEEGNHKGDGEGGSPDNPQSQEDLEYIKRAAAVYQTDRMLHDLCKLNAITKENFIHDRERVEELEFFMSNMTRIQSIHYFPNLKKLSLFHLELTRIEGLNALVHLELLRLNGNMISKIEELDNLKNLKELYLFVSSSLFFSSKMQN